MKAHFTEVAQRPITALLARALRAAWRMRNAAATHSFQTIKRASWDIANIQAETMDRKNSTAFTQN